jgi:hypothetical protein
MYIEHQTIICSKALCGYFFYILLYVCLSVSIAVTTLCNPVVIFCIFSDAGVEAMCPEEDWPCQTSSPTVKQMVPRQTLLDALFDVALMVWITFSEKIHFVASHGMVTVFGYSSAEWGWWMSTIEIVDVICGDCGCPVNYLFKGCCKKNLMFYILSYLYIGSRASNI